jgi:hypothetical protein
MAELVHLTVVSSEAEAELLVALLRTEGIESDHRPTNVAVGAMDGLTTGGPREIVVAAQGLDRAREILASSRNS